MSEKMTPGERYARHIIETNPALRDVAVFELDREHLLALIANVYSLGMWAERHHRQAPDLRITGVRIDATSTEEP